jgi:hypothetical protein
MPSNFLVLLPLVAGFLFYRICYYTRFRAQSLEGYRLLLEAVTVGIGLLGLARLFVVLSKHTVPGASVHQYWSEYSKEPYSGTAAGSVLLAVLGAWAFNGPLWEGWKRAFDRGRLKRHIRLRVLRRLALWRDDARCYWRARLAIWDPKMWRRARRRRAVKETIALNWATRRQKNQLLTLLNEAANLSYMVSVTLSNRKFYVGFVKTAPSLDPQDVYFRIYPVMSGYRDDKTLRFQKTTDYNPVLEAAEEYEPFFVTIPIRSVEVANPFDSDAYVKYFQPPSGIVVVRG